MSGSLLNKKIRRVVSDDDLESVLEQISDATQFYSQALDKTRKEYYSQYFTPMAIARQMANMLVKPDRYAIGDHGAGTGILGATLLAYQYHKFNSSDRRISLRAYEIDPLLHPVFKNNLSKLNRLVKACDMQAPDVSLGRDFTGLTEELFDGQKVGPLDAVILNPPYKKINQSSALAKAFRDRNVPVPNMYAAFIVLSVMMLRHGGEMVAIVPRSFCNGNYFYKFRRWLRSQGSIDWVVRYSKRSNCFRKENVLQENIIFRFCKSVTQTSRIRISLCDTPNDDPNHDTLLPATDIFPQHTDHFFLPANADEMSAIHEVMAMPYTFDDLGLQVTTGKLEDFRFKDYLTKIPQSARYAPVIYSQHWSRGEKVLHWKASAIPKPCYLEVNDSTNKKLLLSGTYVLIKRISANDDRTGRCHACVVTADMVPGEWWAIDNHIQVISLKGNKALSEKSAYKLVEYLSNELIDNFFRVISGTTQLNCRDIELLKFPWPLK